MPRIRRGIIRAIARRRALETIRAIARESVRGVPNPTGAHIVFFTVRGWPVHLAIESLLASRLRSMGHDVTFLICADTLPFCMMGSVHTPAEYQRPCKSCRAAKAAAFGEIFPTEEMAASRLPSSFLRTLEALSLQDCRTFTYEGVPYGDLCYPTMAWYLRRATLHEGDAAVYRRVLGSAHIARLGIEKKIEQRRPDVVVMFSGDFFSENVAAHVLRKAGIRFVSHDYAFLERVGVGLNQSVWDHLTLDKTSGSRPVNIKDRQRRLAEDLLTEWRVKGGYQGELFWSAATLSAGKEILESLGLDDRPMAAAFTNLTYESSVIGKDRVFSDQREWLRSLVSHFKSRRQWQLVIRVHPAEARPGHWGPIESLESYLNAALTPLPENVRVVGSRANISSYAIGALGRLILVYASTIGLEFAERSRRVITAADIHYAGRGFTVDPEATSSYFQAIDRCMNQEEKLSQEEHAKLVDYVGWFFFARLCPFEALTNIGQDWPRVTVRNLRDLSSPDMLGVNQLARVIADGVPWW